MKYWVGITDDRWYEYLAALRPDEVNFWRPSGKGFAAVEVGAPFLFKLHSPRNYIVGGGFFVRSDTLPLSLAWDTFRQKNGAPDLRTFSHLITSRRPEARGDPPVGCIILNQPFFIPRDHWIPVPGNWAGIQVGKRFDDGEPDGRALWAQVEPWLPSFESVESLSADTSVGEQQERYFGGEYLRRSRLGQGAFRVLVTSAYTRRCAISGERTLPVLQAAHIKPFGQGPNRVDNGLLLRSDLHILFDSGYVTVTPELVVEVSGRIREEFENGRDYYRFHGHRLAVVPPTTDDRPRAEFLRWHNDERFLANP